MSGSLAILFSFVAMLAFGQTTDTPHGGTIEGVVLDADEKPLAEAQITAYIAGGKFRPIHVLSDAQGKFSVKDVPPGRVYLDAYKEGDGYPYTAFSFFLRPGVEFPTVNVKAGETTAGVAIKLGARAAKLNFEITNQDGKLVDEGAELSFDRTDIPGPYRLGARAKESLLVPPVPFRLKVEAEGYKPWHYGGEHWQDKEGLIALKSGETLNLSIHLERR